MVVRLSTSGPTQHLPAMHVSCMLGMCGGMVEVSGYGTGQVSRHHTVRHHLSHEVLLVPAGTTSKRRGYSYA